MPAVSLRLGWTCIFGHIIMSTLSIADASDLFVSDDHMDGLSALIENQPVDDFLSDSPFWAMDNPAPKDDTDFLFADGRDETCMSFSLPGIGVGAESAIGIEARGEGTCVNSDGVPALTIPNLPNLDSPITEDDEKVGTDEDVKEYWCGKMDNVFIGRIPCCSTKKIPAGIFYMNFLESTLISLANYLLCPSEKVFCCSSWDQSFPPRFVRPSTDDPIGTGSWCYKSYGPSVHGGQDQL